MENNFDLKNYLLNNTLLKESEEKQEEIEENTQQEGSSKMKLSELKAKIREELVAASVKEAEGDEDIEADIDLDVDADLGIDEPAIDDEDPFGDAEDSVEGAEQKAYDAIIAAGQAYKTLGEENDNGGLKTMIDQLAYLDRVYNFPPAEDVFDTEGGMDVEI